MLGFGLFGRIWVQIGPKGDEALRMGLGGGTDVRTYGRTDGRTENLPILQDFVPYRGRCPAIIKITEKKTLRKNKAGLGNR